MRLPKVIADLVHAQGRFDSMAYADCFSETALVHDEGRVYTGRKEIQQWIAEANEKYQAIMQPIAYEENGITSMLTAQVSGSFPGSPLVLYYHLELTEGLISALRITG
ncbi:nuclear transport factor 2 family protein [Chitinophaga agri]|uniref:Nuclear transport factor 2 family protein n=1 Tax=Chitinophaga agri TaxID=2703787 RepID=A0A6B9ZAU7_9BACT|nr:nuclear transport factor 2 family protein [Chitinophaga agri]QHS59236.1 nuclear transport factor 2 family protein [Chitinophaga agri]